MIYPDNFENRIGFDTIRNMLKGKCLGDSAKLLVEDVCFCNNIEIIRQQLDETSEMMQICMLKDNYPSSSYPSVENIAQKIKVEGTCLQLFEIIDIRTILENIRNLKHFFKNDEKNEFPLLKTKIDKICFPTYLYDRIQTVVSKNGTIKDNASTTLRDIRKRLAEQQSLVTKRLNVILETIREQGWISKDLSATMVNGRLVLPIETNHKRKIKGLIHDESASGKTSYIEPQEVVERNNEIRELELAENREIQKILFELTEEFRPYWQDVYNISVVISELDLIRAKAFFGISIEAIIPAICNDGDLDIIRGKHPILYLTLKKEKKEIVPLSFKLDTENRILLISGPNAGGKSVALKTTALLIYMVQCGLPVPVGGSSCIKIFDNIFIDIGDQQSIENDLSTYSSHLQNMKFFLNNSNNKTLILIDEFGSGTDPVIGGIIAESILEELNKKEVFGVITTHYSNLKIFASNTNGIANAAMLIDTQKMLPTFILETGITGSSYALEIAQRIGLPKNVIDKTKEKIGTEQITFDKVLRRVMSDKRYWERKRQQIKLQEKKIEEVLEKNLQELENIKTKKRKIIDSARKESEDMLNSVNRQIENSIRKIKESNADKDITKEVRQEIQEFKEDFRRNYCEENDEILKKYNHIKKKIEEKAERKAEKEEKQQALVKVDENKINIGSKVRVKGQEVIGEVMELGEKNAVISYGNMYTSVAVANLEKVNESEYKQQKTNVNVLYKSYNQKVLDFKPYIDVRGMKVDEVIKRITDLVDEAIMLSFKELKILHGKGNGILRQHIRDYLRTFPKVEACYSEDIRFGGDGITIVKIK